MESVDPSSYVDIKQGLISREIFVDENIYRKEQEKIFSKNWLFVGHESQVAKRGDYFVSRMGEESVILTRDRTETIRVFLNSCRHRGMRVCRYDEGNTPVFTCPYHGWSYGLDGGLRGVPHYDASYYGALDKQKWGLLPARVTNYRGSIWACWSQEAPDFLDSLGAAKIALDAVLETDDGSDGGTEVLAGVQKWRVPSNWKFVAENFAGDFYHEPSHHSVELVNIGPDGGAATDGKTRLGGTRHGRWGLPRTFLTAFPELGHGWGGVLSQGDADPETYPFPKFSDSRIETYHRDAHARWLRNRPGELPPWLLGRVGTLFPNFSFHPRFPRTFLVAHPCSATETEMWRWYIVDRNAPDEVKEYLRNYFLRYSGPAGMTEQDDMENWNYATAASAGPMARKLAYNYQQGLGHWQVNEQEGTRVSESSISDSNALALYGRWATLMEEE